MIVLFAVILGAAQSVEEFGSMVDAAMERLERHEEALASRPVAAIMDYREQDVCMLVAAAHDRLGIENVESSTFLDRIETLLFR